MSCSIKRFKCDTNPEKVINTENVKKLNQDLTKLMAERTMLDTKYFPSLNSFGLSSSIDFQTKSISYEKKDKKE